MGAHPRVAEVVLAKATVGDVAALVACVAGPI